MSYGAQPDPFGGWNGLQFATIVVTIALVVLATFIVYYGESYKHSVSTHNIFKRKHELEYNSLSINHYFIQQQAFGVVHMWCVTHV